MPSGLGKAIPATSLASAPERGDRQAVCAFRIDQEQPGAKQCIAHIDQSMAAHRDQVDRRDCIGSVGLERAGIEST
jgi:hypothetical protein